MRMSRMRAACLSALAFVPSPAPAQSSLTLVEAEQLSLHADPPEGGPVLLEEPAASRLWQTGSFRTPGSSSGC